MDVEQGSSEVEAQDSAAGCRILHSAQFFNRVSTERRDRA